ncbi:uncharacterized protein LOC111070126 isoform X2 [Drosophila obscura]|uniref:uncharacterized protein LOC111070126 isoform X2 n=1 Tax=Drosophila obscura TaxID=7282 RepID=UPI001BB1F92B|nr:uncharacterized protein LOC111070126 isoform X2 [Drosophila obscura]
MAAPNMSDPVPFFYLDWMAEILMQDTKEMASEFERKVEFVREQEARILENAQQFMDDIKACTLKLEMDLNESMQLLAEADKAASKLERTCSTFPNSCRIEPMTPHNFLDLLKLVASTKKMSEECNSLSEELEEFGKEAAERLAPASMICEVIDYHNKALLSFEEQIDELEGKVTLIANEYEDITEDLGISSLSTTCTCEMAKEVLAKDFCNDYILENNR